MMRFSNPDISAHPDGVGIHMSLSKRLARSGMVSLSRLVGYASLKKLLKRDFYVINYHSISALDVDPYVNENVYRTALEFEEDLRFFTRHFTIIPAVDLVDFIRHSRPLPKDALVITFDDGLSINYDVQLPILKKYGVTASFFLCSAFIDNADLHYGRKINLLLQRTGETKDDKGNRDVTAYLSDNKLFNGDIRKSLRGIDYHNRGHLEEIAKLVGIDFKEYLAQTKPYLGSEQIKAMLADGFSIGAHSVDHPRYGLLALDEQVRQTVDSMSYIERTFRLDCRLFAFPYSSDTLTPGFYQRIRPHVDLVFGMGGFVDDAFDFNIQRAEVESTKLPIGLALKYRFLTSYVNSALRHMKRETSHPAVMQGT